MKFNFTKISDTPAKYDYFIINNLKFDEGLIHILSKYGNETFEFSNTGLPSNSTSTNTTSEKVQISEFPILELPTRISDKLKLNKKFINPDDKKISHFHLFQLILSKVDKELYLLPRRQQYIFFYSVFDSKKKYMGDFTLLDTDFGVGNCQINPQITLDIQADSDSGILRNLQNMYDKAYWKVYGPEKELKTATEELEKYKNSIKERTSQFKDKWGYLF